MLRRLAEIVESGADCTVNRISGQGRLLILPFVTTSSTTDVRLLFLLLPMWWLLGVEQFVWPIVLLWSAWKTLVRRRFEIHVVPTLVLLLMFISAHVVSAFFIDEPLRLITFFRNLSMYVTAFLLVFVIVNSVANWHEIRSLLLSIVYPMGLASIVGVLGISGAWRPSFTSLIGYVLPRWISNTTYGGTIAYRNVGSASWFAVVGQYFRVNSFFLFATLYASALALTLPVVIMLYADWRKSIPKFAWMLLLVLLGVNLIFTTGRIAALGFLVGGTYYLFVIRANQRIRQFSYILVMVTCFLLLSTLIAVFLVPECLGEAYRNFVLARGSGSFLDRAFVYRSTFEGVSQRPVFGWGTERDIPGFPYPAGSHSYYLGILYKQGIVGFLLFITIWWSLWRDTRIPAGVLSGRSPILRFLQYGRWVVIAAMVNALTDVLDLDASTMAIMWLIFSLLIVSRRLAIDHSVSLSHVNSA